MAKSTKQSDEIMAVLNLAGVLRLKLFAIIAAAIMSISPIPSRIQHSVVRWVRNAKRTCTHTNSSPASGPAAAAVSICRLTVEERQEGKRDVLP